MNTVKQRLENRTNKVIQELQKSSKLSSFEITTEQTKAIRDVLEKKIDECCTDLENGRDSTQFKL